MKNRVIIVGLMILFFSSLANATKFVSAIPTSVRLVDNGLVLIGDFDFSDIPCATSPKAIYLPSSTALFNQKLSLALTAYTTKKRIEVLIDDPIAASCIAISAIGQVPVAHGNFWYLKE